MTVYELDEYGSASRRLSEGDLLSGELLGIWPRSGGVSNGRLYERPTLERPTGVSASSSSDRLKGSTWDRNEYPTPSATPYGSSQNEGQISHKRATAGTPSLETWSGSWSTPCANDGARGGSDRDRQGGPSLRAQVRGESRGRLSWRFVAWLMGWRWLIGDTPRPWPPGPDDAEAWADVLAVRPDLAPATAEPEPDRAAMLRLLGNGVVPEQAEVAVGALLRRT